MAKKKYLLGVFDDDDVLLKAAKNFKAAGVRIKDVQTPFPIHGLDPVIGLQPSKLHSVGFIFGALGCILMFLFISWIEAINYPIIIGGKPFLSVPAYIPVTFEVTVLVSAISMVVVFFVRCGLSAIKNPTILDPRITNDKFVMVFDYEDHSGEEIENIKNLLTTNGAMEINDKELV